MKQRIFFAFLLLLGPISNTLGDEPEVAQEIGIPSLDSCQNQTWAVKNWSLAANPNGATVYVSTSGSDANSGLSESAPVKSLPRALSLLRNGYPDRLLLKCGDVWNQSFGYLNVSGRSDTQPLVISSYGNCDQQRPKIISGNFHGIRIDSSVSNIYIANLHFQSGVDPLLVSAVGLRIINGTNIRLEGNLIEGYQLGVVLQSVNGPIKNVYLRRNTIIDNAAPGRSQGLYAEKVQNVYLDENIFDKNGWKEGVVVASTQSHNVYFHVTNNCVIVRNNIFARAASHGGQFRAGGIIENNFFFQNSDNSLGYTLGGSDPRPGGIEAVFQNNVIMEAKDISATLPRGHGLEIANINTEGTLPKVIIKNNVFAYYDSSKPYGMGMLFVTGNGTGIHNTLVENNTFYHWVSPVQISGRLSQIHNLTFKGNRLLNVHSILGTPTQLVVFRSPELPPATLDHTQIGLFNNEYYAGPPTHSNWFKWIKTGTTVVHYNINPPAWKTFSGEINPVFHSPTSVPLPQGGKTILTYLTEKGYEATRENLYTQLRNQTLSNWKTVFSTATLIPYFLSAYGVTSSEPVKTHLGPPSTYSTVSGPVYFTVTYTNASQITLNTDGVDLYTTGSAKGELAIEFLSQTKRRVVIKNISGAGTLQIRIRAGTATGSDGSSAPPAGPSNIVKVLGL